MSTHTMSLIDGKIRSQRLQKNRRYALRQNHARQPLHMKIPINSLTLLTLTVLLTACAQKIWVGKNAESDYYQCQAQASMAYPVAMVTTKVGSGYTSPVNTTCSNSFGTVQCTSTGGNYTPPAEISSDANANRRLAHFGRCMLDRGNKYVSKDEYTPPPIVQQPAKDKDCKDRFSLYYNPKICEER